MANYLTKLRITPDRGGEKARQKEVSKGWTNVCVSLKSLYIIILTQGL